MLFNTNAQTSAKPHIDSCLSHIFNITWVTSLCSALRIQRATFSFDLNRTSESHTFPSVRFVWCEHFCFFFQLGTLKKNSQVETLHCSWKAVSYLLQQKTWLWRLLVKQGSVEMPVWTASTLTSEQTDAQRSCYAATKWSGVVISFRFKRFFLEELLKRRVRHSTLKWPCRLLDASAILPLALWNLKK